MKEQTILLAEDNPDDVKLTLRALAKVGLSNRVEVVSDGLEALEYLNGTGAFSGRNTPTMPQVVLLDLKMPRLNGLEVLECIRANETTRLLPVVILTTSSEEKDMADSYRLGANSYIRKPIDFKEFSAAVQQLGVYWLTLNAVPW